MVQACGRVSIELSGPTLVRSLGKWVEHVAGWCDTVFLLFRGKRFSRMSGYYISCSAVPGQLLSLYDSGGHSTGQVFLSWNIQSAS